MLFPVLFPDEPLTGRDRITSRQQLQVLLWIKPEVRLTAEQLHPVALSVDVKLTLVVVVAFLFEQVQFYDPVLLLAVALTVQLQVALFWHGSGTKTGRQHEQFCALTLVCPVVRLTTMVVLLQLQEFLAKS